MAKSIFPSVPVQPAPIPARMDGDPVEQARFYREQAEWLEYQLSRTKVGWTSPRQGNKITRVLTEYATPEGERFFTLADRSGTEGGVREREAAEDMFPELIATLKAIGNQSVGAGWSHEQALQFCKQAARGALGTGPKVVL